MAELMGKIDNNHRHRYANPPFRIKPPLPDGRVFPVYIMEPFPPEDRMCIHCGHNQKEIKAWQRKNKQSKPKPPTTRPQNPFVAAWAAADLIVEKNSGGLNNWALIYGDGPYQTKHSWSQPCYGSINYIGNRKTRFFIDKAVRVDQPLHPEYIDWLMTEGPYSLAFVNSPSHYKMTRCSIQDCTKMSGQYLVGAAMQFRYMQEYPKIPRDWLSLVQFGVDPAIAFVAASWGQMSNSNLYRPNNGGAQAGHQLLNNQFGSEGLQNYLDYSPQMSAEYVQFGMEKQVMQRDLVPGYDSMEYRGLMGVWQVKVTDRVLVMPGSDKEDYTDLFGRKHQRTGFDFSKRTAKEFHKSFLKINGVTYEPTESIHSKRRSTVREDVPECRVESAAA